MVIVNIVPAIIFIVYGRGKSSFIWSVKLPLSFGGKQEQMSYKKEKEARKASYISIVEAFYCTNRQRWRKKLSGIGAFLQTRNRSYRLQAELVSFSSLGQKKDLLLQELLIFPGCGRHHHFLQTVLACTHPRPSFKPWLLLLQSTLAFTWLCLN